MKVTVIGCGRWGSFLAWYSAKIGHDVILWGRENSKNMKKLKNERKNEYLELLPSIELSNSLEYSISNSDFIIVAIGAQSLREFAKKLKDYDNKDKTFILNMKGIESETGKRLTQVFKEAIGENVNVAVWLGPGHVQDYLKGIPNCMVVSSENIETTKKVVSTFSSELIRFYYGQDLIGNEVGAATKNVMGIAAGMLDGLELSSLKGALMARGTREIARLIKALGGNETSAYGLAHLGDYEATLFSKHSNNRGFGERYAKKEEFTKLAEGVYTIKALRKLSMQYEVDLPITDALHRIIYEEKDAKDVLESLFLRSTKFEF
ncbi:NAD(P)H-dependent glycerol-3-phosphate dehydrogenase [Sporosalibacterium faouarense]|uniref:NAD(P)H-dependent glycerol-3-phosphate dehydrogenase n=1 Tax=Sporosalibacterium faouarense TaxID=516123 RepID=UPI00192A9745|nr:NAD(P)H-dependent glycerol-3-phosphate dehydrogenase [Sporosalibacterium faouarense]